MSYLSQISWRYSGDICILVSNKFRFLVVDFDKTRMMRNATINELFAKHDMYFDAEWKRLNKIDLTIDDNCLMINPLMNVHFVNSVNMDMIMNSLAQHDIDRLKLKINFNLELDSQHCSDAYKDLETWPHGCDNLIFGQ